MIRHLIFNDNNSDKFWQISVIGSSFRVTYGKSGTKGTSIEKSFASEAQCLKEANKLIQEKLRKGYKSPGAEEPGIEKAVVNTENIERTEDEGKAKDNYSLYYQDGSSDKVYHAAIEQKESGYVVNFSFGRRGSTLQTGTKTSSPVTIEKARKLLLSLVNAKKAKGYTEGIDGTPYIQTVSEQRVSGINCQLLNAIEEDEMEIYLDDDRYGAQEKMDGNRMMIRKSADIVEGINRKGLVIALPHLLEQSISKFTGDLVIDGESIGDVIHVFDLLMIDGTTITDLPFEERYKKLAAFIAGHSSDHIKLVLLVKGSAEKRALVASLQQQNKEGIVFKKLDATYKAGRPASGGAQLKFKFYKTATVMVDKVNLKRSVSMSVWENEKLVPVGNVTIPPNVTVPQVNDLIEVRYLYAYRGGSLFQPTFLGIRSDVNREDCTIKQLVYKKELDE